MNLNFLNSEQLWYLLAIAAIFILAICARWLFILCSAKEDPEQIEDTSCEDARTDCYYMLLSDFNGFTKFLATKGVTAVELKRAELEQYWLEYITKNPTPKEI